MSCQKDEGTPWGSEVGTDVQDEFLVVELEIHCTQRRNEEKYQGCFFPKSVHGKISKKAALFVAGSWCRMCFQMQYYAIVFKQSRTFI